MGTRVGLSTAAVLAVLLGLEVALRIGDPIAEVANPLYSFHESDAELGWIGRPGVRQRFVRPDFAALVEHSESGFRLPQPPPPATARERVLFLGDSATWGWGVGQGEVYTDRLQRALAPDVAIVNRGVNGFGTSQEYLLMRRELARDSYSAVAVLYGANDIGDNVDGKRGRRPWFELRDSRLVAHNEVPRPLMGPLKRFFKDSSRAFQWMDFRINLLKRRWKTARRAASAPAAVSSAAPEAVDFRALPGYPETRRLFAEMKALAARNGAAFYVIYLAPAEEYRPHHEPSPFLRATREAIFEIASREGIELIDLAPSFREHSRDGPLLTFERDPHWNAEGHRVAAEALLASALFAERNAARR